MFEEVAIVLFRSKMEKKNINRFSKDMHDGIWHFILYKRYLVTRKKNPHFYIPSRTPSSSKDTLLNPIFVNPHIPTQFRMETGDHLSPLSDHHLSQIVHIGFT